MATNVRLRAAPVHPVASCTSAHNSGDLVIEAGRVGVCVETNAATEPNTLIQHGVVYLPVPGSLIATAPTSSPVTSRGSQRRFCSSVP